MTSSTEVVSSLDWRSEMDMAARFAVVILFSAVLKLKCEEGVFISKTGHDRLACLNKSTSAKQPCRTLDFVFNRTAELGNHTQILIFPGEYSLMTDTSFKNYQYLGIIGLGKVIITCANKVLGISFSKCENIVLSGLTIEMCGRVRNNELYSALHFVLSKNINISNSLFNNNNGKALSMLDVGGRIQVMNVTFRDNGFRENGGGMHIELTKCGALNPTDCKFQAEEQNYIHHSHYSIANCLFISNNMIADWNNERNTMKEPDDSRGGGVAIFLNRNSSSNHFTISNCSFDGNYAKWGGGIYAMLQATSHSNIIIVSHTIFSHNVAKYAGGGAEISQNLHNKAQVQIENKILFKNCFFFSNRAIWGGGLSMRSTTLLLKYPHEKVKESLMLEFCNFTSNYATVGSAFGFSTNNFNRNPVGPGVSCKVVFSHCIIMKNRIIWTEDNKVIGFGALYGEQVMLSFNQTTLLQNGGTSLLLDSSSVTVYGKVLFKENTGLNGGAIAMYGNSWIQMTKRSQLVFERNRALEKGGAIYLKTSGPPRLAFKTTKLSTKKCFLRYEDEENPNPNLWNCSIRFIHNVAPESTGNSLFANTLQHCRQGNGQRIEKGTLQWKIIEYINAENYFPEIATQAVQINAYIEDWHASPSVPFSPRLKLIDEKNNSVFGTIKIDIFSEENQKVSLLNDVFLVKDMIPDIRIFGYANTKFNMSFITTDGQAVMANAKQQSLDFCPPGYSQSMHGFLCECLDSKEIGITRCENYTVFILRGYWAGVRKDGTLTTLPCPQNYCSCNSNNSKSIAYECQYNPNHQCAANRRGILCSKCKDGYSVQLGNEQCSQCSNTYLLLLIPIIFASSITVVIVMYWNLDVFSGYLNAYLYAYQSVNLMLVENIELDKFIGFIIGLTGLSGTGNTFGVCFFNGFTNLHKLGLNLAIPLYIIIFTMMLCYFLPNKLWSRIFGSSKRMNSFGRAFSFLYVLCYTYLTSKSLDLLHPIEIDGHWKLFKAADVKFFGAEHLPYAIAALVVLVVFVIGFPILLLLTPFFIHLFPKLSRMDPAFNTLKNCFKSSAEDGSTTDYRPFAAFYFFCRFVLLMFAIFVKEETSKLVLIATSCVLFQAIFTWFQPYVRWTMNFWDTVILTILCVLSLMNIILSVPYVLLQNDRKFLIYCVRTLVYVPLLTVVFRLAAYINQRLKERRKRRNLNMDGDQTRGALYQKSLAVPFITSNQRKRHFNIPKRLEEDETADSEVGHL